MPYYNAEEIRAEASGRWLHIISALAPQADAALKKPGRHVACPVHGGKDGFRVFKKDFAETGGGICNTCGPRHDGFELLMWLNHWDFPQCLEAIAEFLGVEPKLSKADRELMASKPVAAPVNMSAEMSSSANQDKVVSLPNGEPKAWLADVQEELEQSAARQKQYSANLERKIGRVWDTECVSMGSPVTNPARAYLKNRALTMRLGKVLESDSMRFHAKLPYFDEDSNPVGDFPGLVFAIRDIEGQIITLHRIYLTEKGKKARVPNPKKMMPIPDGREVTGGAIRLGEPVNGVLGLAEGVETALAACRATHMPVWATVNATLLEAVQVPENVHTVVIWADKDRSLTGEQSANVLKNRLEKSGVRVFILMPAMPIPARAKGVDWNDVLLSQGIEGFPNARHLQSRLANTAEDKVG